MNPQSNITEILAYAMRGRRYEPVKRVKDLGHVPRGMRNRPVEPHHVAHRYEIRGGITWGDLIAENLYQNNALLRRLAAR